MTHRFPIKDIAAQAGLGTATIDRVLNGRAHVSARTKARVAAALDELVAQEAHLAAKGRQVWVDVVVEAPERFCRALRQATDRAARQISGAVIRPRFQMQEVMDATLTARTLERITRRGSQGVCLKARDVPRVREAVATLRAKGIPVVALVTDVQGAGAYAGADNAQAGRVAAALIARDVREGIVLTSTSRQDFSGEAERLTSFCASLAERAPGLRVVALRPGAGLNEPTGQSMADALAEISAVQAVYSVGGGNRAIATTLERRQLWPKVFVAHDLDDDNRRLLEQGALSHVLHHDLTADMSRAFGHVLHAQKLAAAPEEGRSAVQIIISENMPEGT